MSFANLRLEGPTEEEMRQVLAAYGFATYEAAGVELCLCQLLAIQHISPTKPHDRSDSRREFFNRRHHNTLGRLIKAVRECVKLPTVIIEKFDQALSGRNWLIHHFYSEGFPALAHRESRNTLVCRLNEMALWYSELSRQLITEIDIHLAQKGISLEKINRETELYLSSLHSEESKWN